MRLYIVSTCLWKIWWPKWCHMFNVTHTNDFVTQKWADTGLLVCEHAHEHVLYSTHCVEKMSVEPKRRKLWDKLYTDTSSHEKICMRTRPCKSKSCAEGRFSQWIHITVLRVGQTNDLWHDFVCKKLYTYTSSCVKICTSTWPCKSKSGVEARLFTVNTVLQISKTNLLQTLFHVSKVGYREEFVSKSRVVVRRFDYKCGLLGEKRWCHMLNVTRRHVFVSQKVCKHSSCSVRTCARTRLVGDTFVWKRGSRDKTWEIRWQVANRHVLICDNLYTETSL